MEFEVQDVVVTGLQCAIDVSDEVEKVEEDDSTEDPVAVPSVLGGSTGRDGG